MKSDKKLTVSGAPTEAIRKAQSALESTDAKKTQGLRVPPPTTKRVLLIMFWKNLTIRKRRKLEQSLLLFQIFIWFGWSAMRFLLRGNFLFMKAVLPRGNGPSISLFHPMAVPKNHPIGLTLTWNAGYQNNAQMPVMTSSPINEFFRGHPDVDEDLLMNTMVNFEALWQRSVGPLRLSMFNNESSLLQAFQEDNRPQFAINVARLQPGDPNISIALSMWNTEIPLNIDSVWHNDACRKFTELLSQRIDFDSLVIASRGCEAGKYLESSFVMTQSYLTTSIYAALAKRNGKVNSDFITNPKLRTPTEQTLELPGVSFKAEDFPLHISLSSRFAELASTVPMFTMFAFSRFMMIAMQDLVAEKESKMKDVMKIFGLTTNQHWTSWLMTNMAMNCLYTGLTVIICRLCNMFPGCSYVVVAFLYYFYLLSLLTSGMMLSVFFDKVQSAGAVGLILNLALNGVGWLLTSLEGSAQALKSLLSLVSTIGFSFAIDETIRGIPMRKITLVNWFNIRENNIGFYSLILVVDAFGYFLIGLYLDNVFKSSFGARKPWYYPIADTWEYFLRATGWKQEFDEREMCESLNSELEPEKITEHGLMEQPSPMLKVMGPAVQIRGLVKEFKVSGEMKRAVDNLSLDIYRSEIFALLGHNGAGKTTTISILTGILEAEGGDAWVNGHSIRRNPLAVQRSISVCPQHNIFLDELLVIEHLCFFAGLRGIDTQEALLKLQNPPQYAEEVMTAYHKDQTQQQMDAIMGKPSVTMKSDTKTWDGVLKMVHRFGLTQKLFASPRSLSGGQKRRMWLALALLAEPHVVFLDEPTSGVDPMARQDIWKVIQDERKSGRCIILTTHHMEEADILADRKAVMAAGKLRCLGSSLFLKSKFGIGYYLEIQLQRGVTGDEAKKRGEDVTELVLQHVPEARKVELDSDVGTMAALSVSAGMLTFALPLSHIEKFAPLLEAIEGHKEDLKIGDYAVSMSTLEEVFFKLGEIENDEELETFLSKKQKPTPIRRYDGPIGEKEDGSMMETFGQHGNRRTSFALAPDTDQVLAGMEESTEAKASDLTSQVFPEPPKGNVLNQLKGVSYLRYCQVFHNKASFLFDIILPTLLFLLGLFIRREGPGGIDKLFAVETADHDFANYDKYINSTIPYMVDFTLSTSGLRKVSQIIQKLPFKDRMMPIFNIMSPESLSTISAEDMVAEILRQGQSVADIAVKKDFKEGSEPRSAAEYLRSRATSVPKFPIGHQMTDDELPYVMMINRDLSEASVQGLYVRNFVWQTTTHDIFGTWQNFYPAALSFEAASPLLTASTHLEDRVLEPDDVSVRYLWNPYAVHALPAFMNGLCESTLSNALDEPINLNFKSKPMYKAIPIFITNLTWGLYTLLSLGLSSLPQRFGSQILYDKYMKTKHSLIVMGCPLYVYWLGTFFVNCLFMLVANAFILGAICYFIPLYTKHPSSILAVLLSLSSYSGAMLVYAYFWTFIFSSSRSYNLFMNLSIVSSAIGVAYVVSIFYDAKEEIGNVSLRYLSGVIHKIASFTLAPYTPIGLLISTLIVITQADAERRTATLSDFMSFKNNVVWTILGACFQILVFGPLIISMDTRTYRHKSRDVVAQGALKTWKEVRTNVRQQILAQSGGQASLIPPQFQTNKDDDVVYEEKRIEDVMTVLHAQQEAKKTKTGTPLHFPGLHGKHPKDLPLILIHNLHHLYMPTSAAAEPTVALKGVSFGVEAGEVFGLLGPNGAGKSTCINLLTCDPTMDAPTEGDGYLGGFSITDTPQRAFPYIGLVPQFDALWSDVTVRDNLITFAAVKGITKNHRDALINDLLTKLALTPHYRKRINELSGGNKRRASLAAAFLGNPRVLLMDEPSSGIDPAGRRKLLEMIKREGKNKAMLITTHSMEEAESLCTKVGIVVNGELQCFNTCLSIKNKYGSGILMEIELASDWKAGNKNLEAEREKALQFIRENLHPKVEVIQQVASRIYTKLPLQPADLSRIFRVMVAEARNHGIKDFAVSQPTLDQVFIMYAKRQTGAPPPEAPDVS